VKMYKNINSGLNISKLMKYARICRVGKVIQPYLESIA
jgi:hypothetical protein